MRLSAANSWFKGPAECVDPQQIRHLETPTGRNVSRIASRILSPPGGLAASPPVRYTLEMARECSPTRLLNSGVRFGETAADRGGRRTTTSPGVTCVLPAEGGLGSAGRNGVETA